MNLAGLTIGQLLAAAGATAVLTVALYLLKLRRRTVEVPFSPLWQAVLSESQTTRLLSRLQHLWSLLLSLLLGAALLLAIADPRVEDADELSHTVVLVDCSPSMAASDVQPSRLAAGVEQVRQLLEHRRPSERILIARMADVTTPLTPMTNAAATLGDALQRLSPGFAEADLPRALQFAADMLEGRGRGRVVLVSDGSLIGAGTDFALPEGVEFRQLKVGETGGNVAIGAFAVRRYPLDRSRSELLIELHNTNDAATRVELSLLADDRTIAVEPVALTPNQRLRRVYDNVPAASERLEARIRVLDGPADTLGVDDRAFATVPPRRRARVLAVTEGNLYLQAALLLDEYVQVDMVTPAEFGGGNGYDAVIFDGVLPPTPPDYPAIYIHPDPAAGGVAPLPVDGRIDAPHFDRLVRDDPLLRWTALRDVNLSSALAVKPSPGDRVIAASRQGALIVAGERGAEPFVALTFDIRHSDLPLRAAWPLLLLNILESLGPDNAADQAAGHVGERLTLSLGAGGAAHVLDPTGTQLAITSQGGAPGFNAMRPGFHTLRHEGRSWPVAVNLPPTLLDDITPRALTAGFAAPGSAGLHAPSGIALAPWALLVIVVALLLSIEWWTYHRRWTV